jgi:ribose transport system ATP-binding protein
MQTPPSPVLEVRNVSKAFPGVRALAGVSFSLHRGEVLALIGENGAGKSTLMKILAGVQQADSGQFLIDGRPVQIDSVAKALQLGISLIHQELNLADNLEVGANIFLGREPMKAGLIRRKQIDREAQRYLDVVGLDVNPRDIVGHLTIGKQQMVEIAKALSVNARVLIMDEPTSSLSSRETERLFQVIEQLRRQGVCIIYISHRLGEVKQVADRVVVLRDGQNAGELTRDAITHDAMVRMMVGRDVSQFYARRWHQAGEVVFEVKDLITPAWPQQEISFSILRGEIVGVAGLVGAGRTELFRTLFGIDKPLGGQIRLGGQPLVVGGPADAIRSGMALVPEDRKLHGLVIEEAVKRNIGLAGLRRNRLPFGFLNQRKENEDTRQMIDKLRIKTPSPHQIVQYLSGGNQQKVVIGKWLSLKPRLLLLDEPTRGIDVGAKEEIYRLMESLAEEGVPVLFASSEMEEILGMSDRVLVMHQGRIMGQLGRDQLSEEAVMQLATGRDIAA